MPGVRDRGVARQRLAFGPGRHGSGDVTDAVELPVHQQGGHRQPVVRRGAQRGGEQRGQDLHRLPGGAMGVDLHHVLPDLGFHRGRMGGLASEPVTGHRRLGLDGGNTEGSGERMSSRGVAGGVGGDERLRPVGLTAQHLLRDVAPQAEPDQDDLPGRQRRPAGPECPRPRRGTRRDHSTPRGPAGRARRHGNDATAHRSAEPTRGDRVWRRAAERSPVPGRVRPSSSGSSRRGAGERVRTAGPQLFLHGDRRWAVSTTVSLADEWGARARRPNR